VQKYRRLIDDTTAAGVAEDVILDLRGVSHPLPCVVLHADLKSGSLTFVLTEGGTL
jgi:hypothetical protein